MKEDLTAPYPGYGFGALDAFDGYVSYRCLDEQALAREIAEMQALIDASAASLAVLDRMWCDDGYFCREPDLI